MQYNISDVQETTTSTGKTYKRARANGIDVSVWSDFSKYTEVTDGAVVEGMIKENGKYKNLVDEATPYSGVKSRGAGMAKAQETKAKYIEQAQARKSDSIAYFNSVNSAIALLQPLLLKGVENGQSWEAIKENIREARDWFIQEYEHYNNPNVKID